jgi:broad specificity phosphatase PhoE
VYDGTKKEWREATAVEKDRYFVLKSDAKEFVDIQDVYESIKDDERVIFVLRHAERGDDTSKSGTLTANGKKQSADVGARLTKFEEDFVLGASEFLRAHQTVENIAKGRGQQSEIRDTIPQLNDDWYIKDKDIMSKVNDEAGGGWHSTSKYAYTGAYTTGANAAFYDLAERSVELIEDVLVKKYTKEKFVLLSSHDKVMVPLVAYCSNLKIELKEYDGGKWINYLAGVAIIIDKDGNRRYVAIRGLKSGYAN